MLKFLKYRNKLLKYIDQIGGNKSFEEILELLKSMNFDPPNFELSNRQLNEIADSLAYGQKINLK